MNKHLLKAIGQAAVPLALGLSCAAPVFADSGVAYVSNQEAGVSVIDLATMTARDNIDIGVTGPRGIGITADGAMLVTANKGGANIALIDTKTLQVIRYVPIGKNPEFVRVQGHYAYVTYEPSAKSGPPSKNGAKDDDDAVPGHIAIVDLKLGKVVHDIVGKPETEGLEFSKDGKKLFITNESDNSLTVHDAKSGKLLKSIPLGKYGNRPRGIKLSPDGKALVTTLELSDKMLVLNDKFDVVKEIATAKTPYGVAFDRSGSRIFVASNKDKLLQVFDAKTYEKVKDIPIGDRCWHFSFTPDDKQILVACGKSNELVVIDAASLEVTKHLGEMGMPWGIVTYPKAMGSIDRP